MFYDFIQCILILLDDICIFVGYDYKVPGCEVFVWEIIVVEEKFCNVYIGGDVFKEVFMEMCDVCDVMLKKFVLIIFFLQVNMCVG